MGSEFLAREDLENMTTLVFLGLSLKVDFLSSQKPLAASKQVLASSQNNFLSSHLNEHRPSWSFKQRQLNQAITITLRLTEYANIFLNTCPVVVFSDLSLQPLLPCTRSQQCFTTATIPSSSAILNISNCHVVVL